VGWDENSVKIFVSPNSILCVERKIFRNIKDKKAVFPKHFTVEAMDIITSVSIGLV